MADTLYDLKNRRSIRKYLPDAVKQEDLDAVLEAGLYSPSARGLQRACIVVVRNKEERDLLSELNRAVMGAEMDPFYGAPMVLVVFGDGSWPQAVKDGSLIMGNLMNAAQAVGLGSCWIDRAEPVFASEEGKALMKKWGVPEEYVGVGHCILGYAAETPDPKPRRENFIIYAD